MHAMTKRERVMRAARFEETDRVPFYDILQNDAVIEHYAGRPLDYEDGERTTGLAVGRALDMTRMVTGPQRPTEIVRDDGFRIRIERWTSWLVERPFRDIGGLLSWIRERVREDDARVFTPEDAAHLRRRIEAHWAVFAEADPTGRGDPTVFVLESGVGLDGMVWAAGMRLFTELMCEHPDALEEWLDARNRAEIRRAEALGDPLHLPIVLVYDDIAHKTGTLFSPDWLRAVWAPRLRALVDAWRARDALCLFHSDGNLWAVLDDLVKAGIDGLNPLETLAGMEVAAVRRAYPRLFLTGGIDVSQLLSLGTPEEVRQACRQAIADTGGRGYFLGSSTELHWEVPLENARAMYDLDTSLTGPA